MPTRLRLRFEIESQGGSIFIFQSIETKEGPHQGWPCIARRDYFDAARADHQLRPVPLYRARILSDLVSEWGAGIFVWFCRFEITPVDAADELQELGMIVDRAVLSHLSVPEIIRSTPVSNTTTWPVPLSTVPSIVYLPLSSSTTRVVFARFLLGISSTVNSPSWRMRIVADGPTVFANACRLGAEGIVSKNVDCTYPSSQRPVWKVRNPASLSVQRERSEN